MKNNASVKKIMSRGRAVIGNEFTKAFALDKPVAVIRENDHAVRLTQRKLTKKMKENQVSSVIPHFNGSCQVSVSKYFGSADSVVIYNDFEKSSDVIVRAI